MVPYDIAFMPHSIKRNCYTNELTAYSTNHQLPLTRQVNKLKIYFTQLQPISWLQHPSSVPGSVAVRVNAH